MQEEKQFTMNEKQKEIAKILRNINYSRPIAGTLACLSCGDEISSWNIENMAGLRQPEVSIAMNFLIKKKGWVDYREVKANGGKGRPMKYYKLIVPMDSIISSIEEQVLSENQMIYERINGLKGKI
jgi:predicted transcriptional regulator